MALHGQCLASAPDSYLQIQAPYTRIQAGLHLLIDSAGIKFLGEGKWKCKKHGPEYDQKWRKFHIDFDAQALQIRTISVTSNNVSGESDLLEQLPDGEELACCACGTQQIYEAVAKCGALAVIPSRPNARIRKAMSVHIAMLQLLLAGD